MEKIQLLLEEYSSNKKHYTEDRYFKFLKKIYQTAKSSGALNINFLFYTLNTNSPKNMDKEFMKMYIDTITPNNSTLVAMFKDYWNENMGLDLLDGLPAQFNLAIKEEEVFASMVANNDLEKVLLLLDITADRIASITSNCKEDMFYSKCLNDYERNEFKNAVAGLQFFGFSKKEKEEKARKKFERELYSEMELEYIKDKSNGLLKDIKMLQDEVVNSLKKQFVFKIPQDLNKNAIDLTLHLETGEDIELSKFSEQIAKAIENDIQISFLQFDSRKGKFTVQKELDYDEDEGWQDINNSIFNSVKEAYATLKIDKKMDFGDNDSFVEFYIDVETLFNLNDKYKKLFEKRAKEEFYLDDF